MTEAHSYIPTRRARREHILPLTANLSCGAAVDDGGPFSRVVRQLSYEMKNRPVHEDDAKTRGFIEPFQVNHPTCQILIPHPRGFAGAVIRGARRVAFRLAAGPAGAIER